MISDGNKFGLAFLSVFAFIYFAIIEPHFARDRSPEQHIENTLRQIAVDEAFLQTRLERIHTRDLSSWLLTSKAAGLSRRIGIKKKNQEDIRNELEKTEEKESSIREKIVQLGVSHQALSKAKIEKKQYSIPIVSVSIDEETLLKFFPLLVILGLTRLLFYRFRLIESIPDAIGPIWLPVWAVPVPFRKMCMSVGKWVMVNFAGFVLTGSIILLTLRFIFLYARENRAEVKLAAIDALLIAVWAVIYFLLIAYTIFEKRPNPGVQLFEHESE